jgi:hypothetical protein
MAIDTIDKTRPITAFVIVVFALAMPSDDPADTIYLNPP